MTQEELEKRLIELEYKASGAASLCGCLARLDLDGSAGVWPYISGALQVAGDMTNEIHGEIIQLYADC